MSDTTIEWTHVPGYRGRTWNATRGCSRVSPGCGKSKEGGCYAEKIAERFAGPGLPFEGFARQRKDGGGWTGKLALIDDKIDDPLAWREPSAIFTNSTSDLFHEALPDAEIDRVFATQLLSPHHLFLTLTKRACRMREYLTAPDLYARVLRAADEIRRRRPRLAAVGISNPQLIPPGWIWWGVSVEDQRCADERIPELLACPAAVRFVSYEPALGPVRFTLRGLPGWDEDWKYDTLAGREWASPRDDIEPGTSPRIDWIIVGGESGPGARPMDLAWARSTIAQCRAAGVPVFVKIGARPYVGDGAGTQLAGAGPAWSNVHGKHWRFDDPSTDPMTVCAVYDRKGGTMEEWPEDLRVRQFPEAPHG